MNSSNKSRHPCVVSDPKVVSFLLYGVSCELFIEVLCQIEEVPSTSNLVSLQPVLYTWNKIPIACYVSVFRRGFSLVCDFLFYDVFF
jgi:hypothetical protein